MKTKLISVAKIAVLFLLVSCNEDEPEADPREPFLGKWEGACAYTCPELFEEERSIEFNISSGAGEGELILDLVLWFNKNDPTVFSDAQDVVAVATEDGFEIEGQWVDFNTGQIYISGTGVIKNGELEFSLDVPVSASNCILNGTIPRE